MGERARIESVDALLRFRANLCQFAEKVRIALDEAEAEIQRTIVWVKQQQHNHWKRQGEKRAELCTRAKSALKRKQLEKTALGGKFSYIEEEKALLAAQRNLDEAREKFANVRRWSRLLDEESFTYKSVSQGMSQAVEVEVPVALAHLDNMIAALEAYATSGTQIEQRSTATLTGVDAVAREDYESMSRAPVPNGKTYTARYKKLRERTPPPTVRETVEVTSLELEEDDRVEQSGPIGKLIERLDPPASPPEPGEIIIAARGVWQHPRIYLERLKDIAIGDSGWYIGFADETEASGYEAVRAEELAEQRRDLGALLNLEPGCLVVLDGGEIVVLLDERDELLWPRGAQTR